MLKLGDLRVADVMSGAPVFLSEHDTIVDALGLLSDEQLHAAPVVGRDGVLLSVLSTTDLLRALTVTVSWTRSEDVACPDPEALQELAQRAVGRLVVRSPVTCSERTSLQEACRTMIKERVHRLIVMRGREPVGVLAAVDAVRAIAALEGAGSSAGAAEEESA